MSQPSELTARIDAWVRATHGSTACARDVGSLGGHSGITVGFDVVDGGVVLERLVLKIPPPGVARRNNFDVLRQVPLLQALEANAIPAPRARYWSNDESAFGAPYLIMSRLPGRSPPDLFTDSALEAPDKAGDLFSQAMDVLAAIHAIDVSRALADWDATRHLDAEIEHWARILTRATNPDWLDLGQRVRDLLHLKRPAAVPFGLVHGDYYSNNWVFDGSRFSGVVDWEGASLGPSLLDVGWAYLFYDRDSWGPRRTRSMAWQPAPAELLARYRERSRLPLADLDYYRALAAYRLGCITAYYFEEHRSGRRPNEAWEVFGEAFPRFMGGAEQLLLAR